LKSGMAYLGHNDVVVAEELSGREGFRGYNLVRVTSEESYAANCLRINDHVLLPAGCPRLEAALQDRGHETVSLEVSEFQKMDGGLSCLSLRF
jgi:dimethylargininase